MEPLFFGDADRPLFGIHDPPTGRARELGVVVCPPAPQEYYTRLHGLRRLAEHLARQGYDVFRFDWSGTGDSAGQLDEVDAARWCADVQRAVDELEELAGVRRVSLVGLRLGALLAARAVEEGLSVRDLVLWEPPASGGDHLRDLAGIEQQVWAAGGIPGRPAPDELLGFHWPASLRASVEALDLTAPRRLAADRILLFGPATERGLEPLRAALADRTGRPPVMTVVAEQGEVVAGTPTLSPRARQQIVSALAGRAA